MPAERHTSPDTNVIRTHLSGYDLLLHPELNKGTAFTEEERTTFALHGLLPPHVGTLEEQRERRKKAFGELPTSFAKYTFMRDLQDSDEVLFYSFIEHNTEELLPVVYTPAHLCIQPPRPDRGRRSGPAREPGSAGAQEE